LADDPRFTPGDQSGSSASPTAERLTVLDRSDHTRHGRGVRRIETRHESPGGGVDRLLFASNMIDLAVYGRQEGWEDALEGRPEQPTYG
jgi:hypothetical protein